MASDYGRTLLVSLGAVLILGIAGGIATKFLTSGPSKELVAWTQWIIAAAGAVVAAKGILTVVPRLGESQESKLTRRKAELVASARAAGLTDDDLKTFLRHNNLTR